MTNHLQTDGKPDGELTLAIVGAGVMGAGIAQCAAEAGLSVVLIDAQPDALERARATMRRGVRLRRMLTGAAGAGDPLARIRFTTELGAASAAQFVIESIREDIVAKQQVFRALDGLAGPEACFASNTSAIPIARLAAVTARPARVLGIHFMNPVALRNTVELIRAPATSDETLATARALLARLAKDCVEVGDGAGFVGNRVLMLTVNEAIGVCADGRAAPGDIDRVFTGCLGHKLGPLATADLIGLDVILDTLVVLAELAGERFRPHPLLVEKVARGELGVKTQRGFFVYPEP